MGIEERGAERTHEAEQLLHVSILGAAQRERVELGAGEERAWIDAAAMGRVEHKGGGEFARSCHVEGRRKLAFDRLSLAGIHALNLGPHRGWPASRESPVNSANESSDTLI